MTTIADRLAWIATTLAAAAAAIGLLTRVYRDVPAMVDQAQGTDLATLFAAVPVLVLSLWLTRRGSAVGRVVTCAALAYLVYTYAIYCFQVVVSPLTPAHIAILGLATWSLALGVPVASHRAGSVGHSLPRRSTAAFLVIVVVLFGGLWLGQIASAITSGTLPRAVSDLHLPTSAVYTLDLGFALPVLGLAAVLLVRRTRHGEALALGGLVFVVLMALSILGLFGIQSVRGSLTDPSMIVAFGVVGLIGAMLALRGVLPTGGAPAEGVARPAGAH